ARATPPSRLLHSSSRDPRDLHSFPTRRSSDLPSHGLLLRHTDRRDATAWHSLHRIGARPPPAPFQDLVGAATVAAVHRQRLYLRSEEHTSALQSRENLVCRLLLEKKKKPAHSN